MSAGNRSVLVILDSRRVTERSRADLSVFAALDHFGVAWEVLDTADYYATPSDYIRQRAAYVFAHDGAGASLADACAGSIAEAVRHGVGLLSLDRETDRWPAPLVALAPAMTPSPATEQLRFGTDPHFITTGHLPGETFALLGPAQGHTFADPEVHVLAANDAGAPVVGAVKRGAGRCVYFGLGDQLYREEVLGHTRGLDGLLWRSLVWVARKPFPMRCVPPFLTSRMDDCNGTYSAFGYVDVLNRHGISPNLGLFVDELGPSDWASVTRLFKTAGADFSMHAFRDDLYKANPKWRPYAPSADKPDLSDGGKACLFEGLSLDHATGCDLEGDTIRDNFRRMDEAFDRAGIRHSRVLNAHFGEIGLRALPSFLERGIDLPCNNSVIGQLYGSQPVWRPRPYALRAANGRYGLVIDRLPKHPSFTSVGSSAAHLGPTHMTTDILHGHTPFVGEADRPRIDQAIARGRLVARTGLDNLAFGTIFTHEQRIHSISLEDWECVVEGILAGLRDVEYEPTAREQVAVVCKRLLDSRLATANYAGEQLSCGLTGTTDGPSPLTVWHDEGDQCRRECPDIPAVDGFLEVTL